MIFLQSWKLHAQFTKVALLFAASEQLLMSHLIHCVCFLINNFLEAVPHDNIDVLLENLEQTNGLSLQNEDCGGSDRRSVLHVEHRWGHDISHVDRINRFIFSVLLCWFSPPRLDSDGGDKSIDLYVYMNTSWLLCQTHAIVRDITTWSETHFDCKWLRSIFIYVKHTIHVFFFF